jgi:hypothetical protein
MTQLYLFGGLFFILKLRMLGVILFIHPRTRIDNMDTLFDFERFPSIETPRLLLRELQREDADSRKKRGRNDPSQLSYS